MKKYTFTLTIEDTESSNEVANILQKVAEEDKKKQDIELHNKVVWTEMKSVLNVIHEDLSRLLKPLDLKLCTHFRVREPDFLRSNNYGIVMETMIGGKREHNSLRGGILIRIHCPINKGRIEFNPVAKSVFNHQYRDFTTSEELIRHYSDELTEMYKANR